MTKKTTQEQMDELGDKTKELLDVLDDELALIAFIKTLLERLAHKLDSIEEKRKLE